VSPNHTPASATPTLNVLTDAPGEGDERQFLSIMTGTTRGPHPGLRVYRSAFLRDNSLLRLRIYIDNGAEPEPDCNRLTGPTIAKNTSVRVAVWESPDKRLHIFRAWIYAENTKPSWITDAVGVITEGAHTLRPVPAASSQYSESPSAFDSYPQLKSYAITEPAGMVLGSGLLGSCWSNRFLVYLVFRQV
jgi:hypothetical protein